jgi:hypothetical protein
LRKNEGLEKAGDRGWETKSRRQEAVSRDGKIRVSTGAREAEK